MIKQSNQHPKNQGIHLLRHFAVLAAFVFFSANSYAKTYYFSSSTGNDSYSSAQAENQATPWRSLAKLNSFMSSLAAGDYILFKRGDVFYGSIVIAKSGSSGNPINFGAYGSGNKPIISGFSTLSSWASVGGGIYQATIAGISNNVNMVTFNNQPQIIGRYPNADAANGGYLTYESFNTYTSITDNQLSSSPSWTGAELVIRKTRWVMDRCLITSHSGSTINYSSPNNNYSGTNGYGYFIQKDAKTLDQLGEWYYNTSSKYMQMYFGGANPTSYAIKVSTNDVLFNASKYSNITVSDLAFEGGNLNSINIGAVTTRTSNISVLNCDINFSGSCAIYATNSDYVKIENCSISNSYNNAIEIENEGGIGKYASIRNNTINNSGYKAGMGASGNSYQGIVCYDSDAIIEYNKIYNTGYSGISFFYNNSKVRNNLIDYYSFVKDDGAGIYTWAGSVATPNTGREIKNNIILNGIGAALGKNDTEKTVHGIYIDDKSSGVDISGNSIANIAYAGLYVHNSKDLNITSNTIYNCGLQQVLYVHESIPDQVIRNVVFNNNILVAKTASQLCFNYRTIADDVNLSGPTDNNYYARPIDDDVVFSITSPSINSNYSLEKWKSSYSKDANSKKSPKAVGAYTVNSLIGSNLFTNGDFASNISGMSFWTQNSNQTTTWDNTSKLTGTGSLRLSFPSSVANVYGLTIKSIGAVSSAKNYILKITTLGTTVNGSLRAYLRKTGSPYNNLVPIQIKSFGTSVKNHEFLFSSPISDAGADVVIEIQQNSGTTYIDNISFSEANVSPVNIDGQLRFEYNSSSSAKTVSLDAKYVGIDNTTYDGSITLQPYTSKILIKNGVATGGTPPPPPTGQTITASASVPAISCFGGSTNVTVTGSGGTAPYTGAGSFVVNAGTGSLRLSFPTSVNGTYGLLHSPIGAVSSTKNYILRFSTLGTTGSGNLRASIMQAVSPFSKITSMSSASYGTTRVDHEFLFKAPPTTSAASFLIEINQNSGTTYIDNIAFFEATSTGTIIGSNLYTSNGQFETGINGITIWSQNTNFIGAWDVSSKISNTYYYTVKDAAGAIATATAATVQPASALKATSTAANVTVAGGTTTVVVAATGGTSPYTGTGSFSNVKAGTYNYTVTDAKGCTSVTSITVTEVLIPGGGSNLTATASGPAISCFDGTTSITVSASGGTLPYTGTNTYTLNAGRATLKLSFPTSVNGSYGLLHAPIGPVSSSKNYILRFSTLGTTGTGNLRAAIMQAVSPFSKITPVSTASYGATRVDHEFLFKAPPTTSAASFLIEINQNSGTTYIDNIAFFEATSTGKIISADLYNGQGIFETGISGINIWSQNNNFIGEADFTSKITNTYYIPVKDATGAIATATALTTQPASALKATSTAANVTVTGGTTTVVVSATGGTGPYTGIGSFANVKVGTYSYTVNDAKGCTSTTTISVKQGAAARVATPNSVIFDSTTNRSLSSIPNAITGNPLSIKSYPNPSNNEFSLFVEGGTSEIVNISLLSAEGRIVYKAQGASNRKYVFGNNLLPGMYIIQVIQGNVMQTLKVVKVK